MPAPDFFVPDERLRARFAAPLDAAALRAALDIGMGIGIGIDVRTLRTTASTHADLLTEVRRTAPARPRVLATVEQTAGRGRLGRRWRTVPGSALLFSLAWPTRTAPALLPAAALVAGVALAETLQPDGARLQLKWPNDLLLDGRKLGGVLAELAVDAAGARTLVLGVGINLWCDPAQRAEIDRPVAALTECWPAAALAAQREAWLARLAQALLQALAGFEAEGFVPFHARYTQRLAWRDEDVELTEQQTRLARGRLYGVDREGRLLVAIDGRLRACVAGELSLRAATPLAA
jgi:BirA family biotin operon repressor/biotin-[acetyl-CoA-carboxylase] ligase